MKPWIPIFLPALAGMAIFLFGMKVMETALHRLAGGRLNRVLERFTQTPVRGLATGAITTAALQSSTAVTVMTIGLVNAGILRFTSTLGVILGTNVGTCLTTELIGLSLNRWAVPILIASAIGQSAAAWFPAPSGRSETWQRRIRFASLAFGGFGCILLGMTLMQSIMPPLREHGLFDWLVRQASISLLWGVLAGAAVSALVHSSAVTIALAMGLAVSGTFPPELAIAVVLGANVGTCVTALVASIGGSRFGVWVAWSHVILNAAGAALFYPLIGLLADIGAWLSPSPGAQIAHAQTIFNVACSLLALPACYLPALRRVR